MKRKVAITMALGKGSVVNPERHEIDVVLISPGEGNGLYFKPETLAKALPLFEGCQAYADHPGKKEQNDRPERSIRDLVGYYHGGYLSPDGQALRSTLSLEGSQFGEEVFHKLEHAIKYQGDFPAAGERVYCGLSINAYVITAPGVIDGRKIEVAEEIAEVVSVDIVTIPARGGGPVKVIMSKRQKEASMEKILKLKTLIEKLMVNNYTDTEKQVFQQLLTLIAEIESDMETEGPKEPETIETTPELPSASVPRVMEAPKEMSAGAKARIQQLDAQLRETTAQLKQVTESHHAAAARLAEVESREYALAKMRESKLPQGVHDLLLAKLSGKPKADIDAELALQVKLAERMWVHEAVVSGVPERFAQQTEEVNIFADCRDEF